MKCDIELNELIIFGDSFVMMFDIYMVHGSWFKLKDSVIIHKEKYFQKKCLKSKMLSDLASTSDVTLSGEDDGSKPKQKGLVAKSALIHFATTQLVTITRTKMTNLFYTSRIQSSEN